MDVKYLHRRDANKLHDRAPSGECEQDGCIRLVLESDATAEIEQARKVLREIEIVAHGDQEDVTVESLLAWLRQTIAPRRQSTKGKSG